MKTNKIAVTTLSIDRLTIVVEADDLITQRRTFKLFDDPEALNELNITAIEKYNSRYRKTYDIFICQERIGYFQFAPKESSHSFFRLDINPSRLSSRARTGFKRFLKRLLKSEMEERLLNAKVTRIDTTLDIQGIDMNEVNLMKPNTRKSGVFCGAGGVIETIYLGTVNTPKQLTCYNKSKQLEECLDINTAAKVVRLEARNRPRNNLRWKDIMTLENPFEKVSMIVMKREQIECYRENFRFFIDACCYRGISAALATIKNRRKREIYRQRLLEYKFQRLDGNKLWATFADAVNEIAILPDVH